MNPSLEDRLRSYYQDRTAREELPPDTGRTLAASSALPGSRPTSASPWSTVPVRVAAVAALVLAVVGVSLVVATTGNEEPGPSTGPDPDGESEETPVTTDASLPSTTSTSVPDTSNSTTTTTTAGAPAGPERTSVVGLYGELGGWDGTAWVQLDEGWEPTPAGRTYQTLTAAGAVAEATSVSVPGTCPVGDEPYLEIPLPQDDVAGAGIAVAGVADPRPRPVEQLDPAADTYRAAAVEAVTQLDLDDPAPEVRQVVRVDLDGDGTDEVLVAARRQTVGLIGAPPGEYGVLFLRRVVDGEVTTTIIDSGVSTVESPILEDYGIGAVADLNGDGRMELVVNVRYYEGSETTVYEMGAGGAMAQVLTNWCGV